jgi:hypothetical protein
MKSMPNFIMYCIAAITLVSLVACSDDSAQQTSTTTQQSATMQTDTKDMHPAQH